MQFERASRVAGGLCSPPNAVDFVICVGDVDDLTSGSTVVRAKSAPTPTSLAVSRPVR
jgi:hypothetical protein